jgi:hypothetical protein
MLNKEQIINMVNNMLMMFINESNNRKINHDGKLYKNKNNGEWGYCINLDFGEVATYMLENNLKTIIDLGAGIGHGIEILNTMGLQAKGYEIKDSLIKENAHFFGKKLTMLGANESLTIEKKDIMNLTKNDIKDFEVIYLWQPFKDKILLNKFFINLFKIISLNQIILFKKDNILKEKYVKEKYLQQFTDTKIEEYGSLEVFKK